MACCLFLFEPRRQPIRRREASTSIVRTAHALTAILTCCQFAGAACVFAAASDPEAERTDLQEVCTLDGKWLSQVGPGNHVFPGRARFALLHDSRQGFWVLDADDCSLREAKLPSPQGREIITPIEVTNDHAVLYVVLGDSSRPVRYGRLDLSTGEHIASAMPAQDGETTDVHFSSDGRLAAWIVRGSETLADTVHVGWIGQLDSGIAFQPRERIREEPYDVIDIMAGGNAILLQKGRRGYLLVDASGLLIRRFSIEASVRPFLGFSLRATEDGQDYLTWDGYRDAGRYVVEWRTNGQAVRKELAAWSTVSAAAVSSDWKWIAVSSSGNARSGGGVESVTVWARDGTTRYHKRLSKTTRASVVFLGDNLFAYPEMDEKGHATTRVFKLTD